MFNDFDLIYDLIVNNPDKTKEEILKIYISMQGSYLQGSYLQGSYFSYFADSLRCYGKILTELWKEFIITKNSRMSEKIDDLFNAIYDLLSNEFSFNW